ncbi:MAG TPA: NADH-quinone oxidoreductase subunit J [Alphaproteobacteria bacterium]|nr:NADH-quinone oxidoreductase subunit J [Alphaproteobacteria bacterium]
MYLDILFYLFASILVLSSVGVIAFKSPMNNLLCLIMCFLNAAGLFILLGAEFLAFLLIMVYVGAVVVMFIFVLMTLNLENLEYKSMGKLPVFATAIILSEIITLLIFKGDQSIAQASKLTEIASNYTPNNTQQIGDVMFSMYAYPFLLISFILLVAMIGSIILTFTKQKNRKQQDIHKQIHRKREDSVELKKVKSGTGVNF